MSELKLIAEFVADLEFARVKTVQLKDQGPPVRHQEHNYDVALVSMNGELADDIEIINAFDAQSSVTNALLEVMQNASIAGGAWMCAPVYRDALIFENEEGDVVRVLNVCFSCHHLLDGKGIDYQCDDKSFMLLAELFKSFGHIVDRLG